MKNRVTSLAAVAVFTVLGAFSLAADRHADEKTPQQTRAVPTKGQAPLDDLLTPYLTKYELPALAAAVVKGGKIIASGAVGTRKAGTELRVTVNDCFHLGSNTKAMTALLAAMLVEEGKLKWISTLPDIFPNLTEKMDAELRGVTLAQFLSHTSGIPSDNEVFAKLLEKATLLDGNLDDQRYWLIQEWSKQPLESKAGTKFAYANMNYVIAGAMIERTAAKTWEELITERVFTQLGLKTAGLGCQSTLGKIDAPLGNAFVDGRLKAYLAGPKGDNLLVLGPAGTAHMSVLDFAHWAGWNAGEGKRGPKLVSPETLKKLHIPVISMEVKKDAPPGTPTGGKYGLGWGLVEVPWAAQPLLTHSGSNQKTLACILVESQEDFGMVIMTNISGLKADEALAALGPQLYTKFAKARRGCESNR